jgi:hypothetical protein
MGRCPAISVSVTREAKVFDRLHAFGLTLTGPGHRRAIRRDSFAMTAPRRHLPQDLPECPKCWHSVILPLSEWVNDRLGVHHWKRRHSSPGPISRLTKLTLLLSW